MRCTITRWMVSRHHDTGRRLPGVAAGHLNRCRSCRDFARSTEMVADELRRGSRERMSQKNFPLAARIVASLPVEPAGRPFRNRRRLPIPGMAAALVILAAVTVLLLMMGENAIQPPAGQPVSEISRVIRAGDLLPDVSIDFAAPIETEMRNLGQAVSSAAETLLSSLQFNLGPEAGEESGRG